MIALLIGTLISKCEYFLVNFPNLFMYFLKCGQLISAEKLSSD